MREKLVSDIAVTPADVRKYFNNMPEDSIVVNAVLYGFAAVVVILRADKKYIENAIPYKKPVGRVNLAYV